MRNYFIAKGLLYAAAVAYPWYEFRVENVALVSYEGIGSAAFPLIVLAFQTVWPKTKPANGSLRTVFSEFLGAAVLATFVQLMYLGFQGYLLQPDEMKQMIRFDWCAVPVVLIVLWLLNRKSLRR